jgi:hypothetical protein
MKGRGRSPPKDITAFLEGLKKTMRIFGQYFRVGYSQRHLDPLPLCQPVRSHDREDQGNCVPGSSWVLNRVLHE